VCVCFLFFWLFLCLWSQEGSTSIKTVGFGIVVGVWMHWIPDCEGLGSRGERTSV
jgi:hypothetical protein